MQNPFRIQSLVAVMILVLGNFSFGHGEDTSGPNGGFIRMPGAYHTELLPVGKTKFKVFLLDINWENPSTKDSFVKLEFKSKKHNEVSNCKAEGNHFECEFSSKVDITKTGHVNVISSRERLTSSPAEYDLPLKLFKK